MTDSLTPSVRNRKRRFEAVQNLIYYTKFEEILMQKQDIFILAILLLVALAIIVLLAGFSTVEAWLS